MEGDLYGKIKSLEDQITLQINVEKSFLIAVARELKALLKPMVALAEIIRSKNLAREKQDEFIEIIIRNDIIDQMVISKN
jgi:hypothetical protein